MILRHQDWLGAVTAQDSARIAAVGKDDVAVADQDANGSGAALVLAVGNLRDFPAKNNEKVQNINSIQDTCHVANP